MVSQPGGALIQSLSVANRFTSALLSSELS